jgi:hypothetical protein
MTRVLFGCIILLALAVKIVGQVAETGFGCYNSDINECSCDDVCNEADCQAIGGIYTDQCTSCQCELKDDEDDDDNDNNDNDSGSNQSANEQEEEGFGCYNLPGVGRSCTCTESVCSEATCTGTTSCERYFPRRRC